VEKFVVVAGHRNFVEHFVADSSEIAVAAVVVETVDPVGNVENAYYAAGSSGYYVQTSWRMTALNSPSVESWTLILPCSLSMMMTTNFGEFVAFERFVSALDEAFVVRRRRFDSRWWLSVVAARGVSGGIDAMTAAIDSAGCGVAAARSVAFLILNAHRL